MKHTRSLRFNLIFFICIVLTISINQSCNKDDIQEIVNPNLILGTYSGKVFSENRTRIANTEIIVSNFRNSHIDCNFKFTDTNTEVRVDSLLVTVNNQSILVYKAQENEFILDGKYHNDSLNIEFKDIRFGSELLFETKKK